MLAPLMSMQVSQNQLFCVTPQSHDWSGSKNSQLRIVGERVSQMYQEMLFRWVRGCLQGESVLLVRDLGLRQKQIQAVIAGVSYSELSDVSLVQATERGMDQILNLAKRDPLPQIQREELALFGERKLSIERDRFSGLYKKPLSMKFRLRCCPLCSVRLE